jgi:hypothetical protein
VFIPTGNACAPASCAENIAASPKTATRPRATSSSAPCDQPDTSVRGVFSSNAHASCGLSEYAPCRNVSSEVARSGTRNAWPVNVATESICSPNVAAGSVRAPREPRVTG